MRLIKVISVVTQHMMQHPQVGGDARVQRVKELQNAIEDFEAERHRVLMVVIPGADHTFRQDRYQRVPSQPGNVINEKIHQEVDHADHQHN
ncbi:MAG: hypothetical protein AAF499_13570 [Pseudomonadota bacterium]